MKKYNKDILLLFLCYTFFTVAVYENNGYLNVYSWLIMIWVNAAIYSVYVILTVNGRKIKPLATLYILIYIIYLFSLQTAKMWKYMKIYHGQLSAVSTVIITVAVLIAFILYDNVDISKLYLPIMFTLILLLIIVFLLNISKLSRYNIVTNSKITGLIHNITLFDYIIPFIVIINSRNNYKRKSAIGFILMSSLAVSATVIFVFLCLSGNLMYSVSPLQAAFQITSTELIRNYDAIFNYFLYFSYFASLICLFYAYKTLKKDFKYTGYWDLFMLIPFMLSGFSDNHLFSVITEITGIIVILFGKEKIKYNE